MMFLNIHLDYASFMFQYSEPTYWAHNDWTMFFEADDGESHGFSFEGYPAGAQLPECKQWWLDSDAI